MQAAIAQVQSVLARLTAGQGAPKVIEDAVEALEEGVKQLQRAVKKGVQLVPAVVETAKDGVAAVAAVSAAVASPTPANVASAAEAGLKVLDDVQSKLIAQLHPEQLQELEKAKAAGLGFSLTEKTHANAKEGSGVQLRVFPKAAEERKRGSHPLTGKHKPG